MPKPPGCPLPGLPPKVDNRFSCPSCNFNQVRCNHCFIHFKLSCPYLAPDKKKQELVVDEGQPTTPSVTPLCLVCKKTDVKLFKCSNCYCCLYYSKIAN